MRKQARRKKFQYLRIEAVYGDVVRSNLWLVETIVSLVLGVSLIGQGLWRRVRQGSVTERAPSKETIFVLRAALVSSGLFLIIVSALLAFGLVKR
jgi:hypothetical protein